MRKLATIRQIEEVIGIEGADKICAYGIGGWKVVDQVGKYRVGDLVVFCEVDSWVPTKLAPFLSKGKEPRVFQGIQGERLKTIKLRNTTSQGLLIKLEDCFDVVEIEGKKYINKSEYNKTARTEDVYIQNNKQNQ